MHDDAMPAGAETDGAGAEPDAFSEFLNWRIDQVVRELDRLRQEREAEAVRTARLKLAVLHERKRVEKALTSAEPPSRAA